MNEKSSENQSSDSAVIEVPADLRGCYPLITQTKRTLEKSKPDQTLLLRSLQKGILNVRVTRRSLHRASLMLIEALSSGAEQRGTLCMTI
jgi:hypothetical protein